MKLNHIHPKKIFTPTKFSHHIKKRKERKIAHLRPMTLQNDLLLRAARGEETPRPPVWLMRQAGRILPQYRALRARLQDFRELVRTPELAAEATIQPVDELDVDAAILISDILVIPEAMGLPYDMVESRGPIFPRMIASARDIERLRGGADAAGELQYVYQAIAHTLKELNGRVPLIGFAGAPWTILAYMVEGQGSKTFSRANSFLYREPALAHRLLEKITGATIHYLQAKISAGAHLLQVFDSWAGILGPEQYREFSLPYIAAICEAISKAPLTVFAKGAWFALGDFASLPCAVVGLDWTLSPRASRAEIGPNKTLQGNLDPCALYAAPEAIARLTREMIEAFGARRYIANLGHGVYPDTPLEGVRCFVDTVKSFSNDRT
jgi:uroporphyrinogen decarboxylase